MKSTKSTLAANVDDYINTFPENIRATLQKIRETIKKAAPHAEEMISYQMPAYKYHGMLVFFAAYKNHIGFYPTPSGIASFNKELSVYKTAKASANFPIDKSVPFGLITKMVKLRVAENEKKLELKTSKKPLVNPGKTKKLSDEEKVNAYLDSLDPAGKIEIETVRKIIRDASPKLQERIKWNAPSYYYKDDIVTFGPYKTGKLLLVFHHAAVVKIKSDLLQGDYKDRRLVYFKNKEEAKKNKEELKRIISEIVKIIDKN